jgi:hypothetical protein
MEVATVGRRSGWLALVLGIALALAPLTAASAAKRHNPDTAICKDVRTEQSGTDSVASAIEKAATAGDFAQAKQAMLNAYDADQGEVQKALAAVKSAPANVRAAFKNLLSSVKQIRADIKQASSLQGLITSFTTEGKATQLEHDGTTIDHWYASVCGGSLTTT